MTSCGYYLEALSTFHSLYLHVISADIVRGLPGCRQAILDVSATFDRLHPYFSTFLGMH